MKFTQLVILFLFFVIAISACKEETEAPTTDFQYDYFPLAVGKYWVYQVDSVLYVPDATLGTRLDSATNFIKEEIVELFVDNAGDTIYKVERFERKRDTQPWQIKKVFTIQRNRTQAIHTEDNLRVIKLIFPLQEGKPWNSTIFLPDVDNFKINIASQPVAIFKHWETEATAIGAPMQVGSFNFDETASISYADETNVTIEYRVVKEVYAKGIGLVKRNWHILDAPNCDNAACINAAWEKKAKMGFILKQTLIAHN